MAQLMLGNINDSATDEEIRAFLDKYGFPASQKIERVPGDGTRPAALVTFERGAAYENMVAGFMNPLNVIVYLAALVFLGLHLYHGTRSMFQTLGLNSRDTRPWIHGFALALAIVIAGGFALVPLAVTFGILTLPA